MKYTLLLGLLILAACTPTQPALNTTNETTTLTGAQFGDLVSINFTLQLENGTLADTNNPELAAQNNLRNYVKGPYTFILGQSGKVKGFDSALVGLEAGEELTTIIEPSEKEVILDVNRTITSKRFITLPRMQRISVENYKKVFGKPPVINDFAAAQGLLFKFQVINMTENTVLARIIAKDGEEYQLQNTYWKSRVAKVADDEIVFYQMPEQNQTVPSPFGPATINVTPSRLTITFNPELNHIFNHTMSGQDGFGANYEFQIIEVQNDKFTIKRYGNLADKRLVLKATMLDITHDVKKVKTSDLDITTETSTPEI